MPSGDVAAEIIGRVKTEMDNASLQKTKSEAEGLQSFLKKALGVFGVALTFTGVKHFFQEATSIAAEVKATNTQFNQTFKTLDENGNAIADFSAQAQEALEKVSKKTGIMESRMKASFASLGAFAKTGGMDTAQSLDFAARAAEAAADSAAYFDKSIEETMDIMKRLMKGNFTLDDNLGFQSTQATRDAQALEMYGKKYQDLESYQQQEVILQQIINANMRMGAVGQAAREADEYTNQVGELNENLKQLKGAIGAIGLPVVLTVSRKLALVTHKLQEYIGDVNDETSRAYRLSQAVNRVMDKAEQILNDIVNRAKVLIQRLGGIDNVVRLLMVAVAAFLAMQMANKLASIARALSNINLKQVAILGLIMLIILVVEDLVAFLEGKKSVIGGILEKHGVDVDGVRQKWEDFKTTVSETWDHIKQNWDDAVKDWDKVKKIFDPNEWKRAWEEIKQAVSDACDGAKQAFQQFLDSIGVTDLINRLNDGWQKIKKRAIEIWNDPAKAWQEFKDKIGLTDVEEALSNAWGNIKKVAIEIWNDPKQAWEDFCTSIEQSAFFQALEKLFTDVGALIDALLKKDPTAWEEAWNQFINDLAGLGELFQPVFDVIDAILLVLKDLFTGNWNSLSDDISNVWKTLSDGFSNTWLGKFFNWLTGGKMASTPEVGGGENNSGNPFDDEPVVVTPNQGQVLPNQILPGENTSQQRPGFLGTVENAAKSVWGVATDVGQFVVDSFTDIGEYFKALSTDNSGNEIDWSSWNASPQMVGETIGGPNTYATVNQTNNFNTTINASEDVAGDASRVIRSSGNDVTRKTANSISSIWGGRK